MTFIFLARLSLTQLALLGGTVLVIVTMWSYSHWRAAVKLALITALLEGAIRKWVFPQGQEVAYFLKDIILFGAYLKFFFAPDMDVRAFRLRLPMTLVLVLAAVVCFSAFNPNIGSAILSVYGIKVYFYYVPLLFMMPYLFRTQQEMVRQLTWFALISIPICILGLLQWKAGVFSVLNVYAQQGDGVISEHGATGFGWEGGPARITGTFSYMTGHTSFVIFFGALCLALLSMLETRFKWLLMAVALPLLAGNALMGGARASIITMGFVCVGFAFASFTGRIGGNKNFLALLTAGMLVAVVGAAFVFADAWAHWSLRYKTAGDTLQSRVVTGPLSSLEQGLEEGGFGGLGMAMTHPATEAIRRVLQIPPPKKKAPVFDVELGQVLVELGVVGFFCWYLLRIFAAWWAWESFLKCPPGPVRAISLMAVLVTTPHLLMSVVLNHTANIFVWAVLGLAMIPKLEPMVQRKFQAPRQPSSRPASGSRPKLGIPH